MSSLRRRISIGVVGITSGVVLIASVGIWLATRTVLVNGVDRDLRVRVERLRHADGMGLLGRRRGPPPQQQAQPAPPAQPPQQPPAATGETRGETRNDRTDPFRFVQFVDAQTGQELMRWSPSSEVGLSAETIAAAIPDHAYSGTLSDGRHVRVLAIRLTHPLMPARDEHAEHRASGEAEHQEHPAPAAASGKEERPDGADKPASAEHAASAEKPSPEHASADKPAPAEHAAGADKPVGVAALALSVVELEQVDGELTRMAWMLAVLWTVATVLAWVAVLLIRSTILRPVGELIGAIDRLGPDDLSARVPATTGPDEVRGLTIRLNVLLDRLEQAFRHEQATIANVAHELRTPVTSLRMAIEFRLMAAPSPDESRTLATCLETVEHMQEMVANLLLLARLEAGKEPLQRQQIDVAALAAEVVESWDGRAAARQQSLITALPAHAMAATSDLHLRLIVGNLIGNAVAHGLPERDIDLAVEAEAGAVRVVVGNPFVGDLDAAQLGKSFYRGDDARSGSDHCGLGLALCRRLARLLGGDLALSAAGGRFTATFTLATGIPNA